MKKIIATILTLCALLSLASCADTPATGSSSSDASTSDASSAVSSSPEPTAHKTYFKQSEPIEVEYIPGDPTTAPVILTEVPPTWKLTERDTPGIWIDTMDSVDCYEETVGEKYTSYDYQHTTGRLLRFLHDSGNNGESDRKRLEEEELRKIADAFVARNADLSVFSEVVFETRSMNGHTDYYYYYHYYIPSPFGEWVPDSHLSGLCEIQVEVDKFGEIYYYYYGLREEIGEIEVPDITLAELEEKIKAEDSFQRYLDYVGEGEREVYFDVFPNVFADKDMDGKIRCYLYGTWYRYDEDGRIAEQEKYFYPLSDFGDYTNLENFLQTMEDDTYETETFS